MPGQNNTEKIFSGLSSQTIVSIAYGVLSLVGFSFFSRILDKADFGYYASIGAILIIFQSLSEAGIGASIIQKKNPDKNYIDTAFTFSFILGLFFTILIILFAKPLAFLVSDGKIILPLKLMSVTLILSSLSSVANAMFMRKLSFLKAGLLKILAYLLSVTIGIVMAIKGFGLYAIITYTILNALFYTIILFIYADYFPRLRITKSESRSVFFFGGWLTLSVITRNLAEQIDKLILSKLLSVSALGAYSRPSGFINSLSSQVGGIYDTILFPILSNIQDDVGKISVAFLKSTKLLNTLAILMALVFIFNAELIITIFFGNQWIELIPIFQIMSLYFLTGLNNRLFDVFLRSLALVKQYFYIRLVSLFVVLISIYIGVKWGILGVAFGMAITDFIMMIIKSYYLCKKVRVPFQAYLMNLFETYKFSIIFIVEGILYNILFNQSLSHNIFFAILFILTTLILFIWFPKVVGEEYYKVIYPKIVLYKQRIIK